MPLAAFAPSSCSAAFTLRPLCVAQEHLWCDHDYPRWGGHTPRARRTGFSHRVGALTLRGADPSLCPAPMPRGQPALTFVDNGGRHPRVPRSPPGFHHSSSRLLSQAPLCEKALIGGMCSSPPREYNQLIVKPSAPHPPRGPADRLFSCTAPPRCPKPSSALPLRRAHNTRRYGHPLAGRPGRSGRPVTVFAHPGPGVLSFLCTSMGCRGQCHT
jgi:hypothetical protein